MLRHEPADRPHALAAALHHSAGPKEKVEMQQNAALRGQTTGTRAREEVVKAAHDTPRDTRHHFWGSGQASLRGLGRKGATPPCGAPPETACRLSLSSLGKAVDSSSLRFLTAAALRRRKEEEEKKASCCCSSAVAPDRRAAFLEAKWQALSPDLQALTAKFFREFEEKERGKKKWKRKRKKRRIRRGRRLGVWVSPEHYRYWILLLAAMFPYPVQCLV